MASYSLPGAVTRQIGETMIDSKIESYKVDEGYSEGTRSENGSESPMTLDLPREHRTPVPADFGLQLGDLVAGLSDHERGELAYDLLRGLRASSIANVFDRLWPQFHKDPLVSFPPELMSLILSYLDPHDLLTTSLVSRAWRNRVTDSNLWKSKFSVEGWGLDGDAIARFEQTFRQPISPLKERRAASVNTDWSAIQSSWTTSFEQQSNMNDGTLMDTMSQASHANMDQEMTDIDAVLAYKEMKSIHPTPGQQSPSHMQITPPSSSHQRPRQPLIITSPPGYSRLNYHYIYKQKRRLEDNWDKGCYKNFQLPHRNAPHEAHAECVYTIQYQGDYLVSGSRDRTLRIWDLNTGRLLRKPLRGHTGSVLCLQFDARPEEDIIVSGSSDTNVILWRFSTGEMVKKLGEAHKESVLNLRFDHRYLVTCSKDKTIKIWNRHLLKAGDKDYPLKGIAGGGDCPAYIIEAPSITGSPRHQPSNPNHLTVLEPYMLLMTLDSHSAAVNAIQIWEDQLVSASGDRSLRIWNIHTGESISKVSAHEKGIACVQYDGKRIVSGSSDCSIRIWDPTTKTEVARLEGHTRLVRTLQAAFADVPGGREKLESEAAEIDRQWVKAQKNGEDLRPGRAVRPTRPGSRRPRDLRALGAKIPPSGGGSRWARIVSGSYDEKVIIWKKNADDEWVIGHQLAQEEALTAAGPPLITRPQVSHAVQQDGHTTTTSLPAPMAPLHRTARPPVVTTPNPPPALAPVPFEPNQILGPNSQSSYHMLRESQEAGSTQVEENEYIRSQSSAPKSSGNTPTQHPARLAPSSPQADAQPTQSTTSNTRQVVPARPPASAPQAVNRAVAQQANAAAQSVGQPNARVFKLQFDARRIVCCSQDNKIVGWDFANEDEDIIACAKFFADPQ